MKREGIVTTAEHHRRGNALSIKDVAGNIRIVSQSTQKHAGTIKIEVTGIADAHDRLDIHATKGEVMVIGQDPEAAAYEYQLQISVPSGTAVKLENVGGTVTISETIAVLTVIGKRPCQIFTDALLGAILRVSSDVNIKVKRLVGRLDLVARAGSALEVRDALISTLAATITGGATVDLYGSARFVQLKLGRGSYFHIDTVDEFVEKETEKYSIFNLGWMSSYGKGDETKRLALVHQAQADMIKFVKELMPDVMPPPTMCKAANA